MESLSLSFSTFGAKFKSEPKFSDILQNMFDGVTWPSTLPPSWTIEWDATSVGEDREE
jgi:hypothetical protein